MINIQVEKNSNENNVNLLRRFTKRVQGSGVLNRVRSLRYAERQPSTYTKKKMALKKLRNREKIDEQVKLGKVVEKQRR